MLYLLVACITVALLGFGFSYYDKIKQNLVFTNSKFRESYLMSKLVDGLIPDKKSGKYIKYEDYIFVLDSSKNIRDLYLWKVICATISIIVGVCICITNVHDRTTKALTACSDAPITLTLDQFNTLTDGVDLKSITPSSQTNRLSNNIGRLKDDDLQSRLRQTRIESLFEYLQYQNNQLNGKFKIFDIAILALIIAFGWTLPNLIVSGVVKILLSNELVEFDTLESDILMMSDRQVIDILLELEKDSLFYREMFYNFRLQYSSDPQRAYQLVSDNKEFPEMFKKLIRYLNMIERDGDDYVNMVITTSKKNTRDTIEDSIKRQSRKQMTIINGLVTTGVILAVVRLVFSIMN